MKADQRSKACLDQQGPGMYATLGATNSCCAAIVSNSRDPASTVRRIRPWMELAARPRADAALPDWIRWYKNNAAIASPAPLPVNASRGVRRSAKPASNPTRRSSASAAVAFGHEAGDQDDPWTIASHARPQGSHGRFHVLQRGAGCCRQQAELKLVRRQNIGGRHRTIAEERRDVGPHIDAGAFVAHDRIAAPNRPGVGRAHPVGRIQK